MGASANATLLDDLLNPQVVADYIDQKLIDAIRLSPLARIDDTLVGRPGDTITLPSYSYIGDATTVAEGADIPIAKLSADSATVKVSKIGRAVEVSDEAILSGFNGIAGGQGVAEEAAKQILLAINAGVETQLLTDMATNAKLTATIAASGDPADGVADALTNFEEDIDGDKVLVIPPSFYARLRKSKAWIPNTEIGADAIIKGTIGMVHGCQVVPSNRMYNYTFTKTSDVAIDPTKTYYVSDGAGGYVVVKEPDVSDIGDYYERSVDSGSAYIVKPGALAIFMKRDTLVEFDRDRLSQMNYIIGSKLFAPYVYDKTKLIKIALPTS